MADPAELPEPDRIEGAPHPRETLRLIGHDAAEQAFLDVYNSGRLHHGWLITGARGVGKATLAWRIARFLLATPPVDDNDMFGAPPTPDTLDIPEDHPVMRRSMALSEPNLYLLRRGPNEKGDKLANEILVKEVRKLKGFFAMSSADGGRRVVIIDAADEMNTNAANAILKLLEEPPANTILLLICHQPARLLPTIRSRCRELRLSPMSPSDVSEALAVAGADLAAQDADALGELAVGSVGDALRLINQDGLTLYQALIRIMATLPDLDRPSALNLAQSLAARGQEEKLALLFHLVDFALNRLARTGLGTPPARFASPEEQQVLTKLSPDPAAARAWATLAQEAGDRARHGLAVNVDPASIVFDLFLQMRETAARLR